MTYQMDLRDLRYFETIAEKGHVGRAAKELCLTQPALTGCIRRLEEAFATPLFERVGRGIRLTPAGEVLLERARRLRVASDEIAHEMEDISRGVAGHIRLGVAPTAAQHLLPPVFGAFLAETKDVTVKAVLGQNDVLTAQLKAGELDLVICPDTKIDEELASQRIFEDIFVVAAANTHEIFRKRATMQDLLAYRWVLAAPTVESRQWLDRVFDLKGLPRPIAQIETNFVALLPPLIAQTGLLSFISRQHLGPGRLGSPLKEVALKETTMRRRFGVIRRKESYLSPAAERFVNLLRANADGLFRQEQG